MYSSLAYVAIELIKLYLCWCWKLINSCPDFGTELLKFNLPLRTYFSFVHLTFLKCCFQSVILLYVSQMLEMNCLL
jgi:hypothetical protein